MLFSIHLDNRKRFNEQEARRERCVPLKLPPCHSLLPIWANCANYIQWRLVAYETKRAEWRDHRRTGGNWFYRGTPLARSQSQKTIPFPTSFSSTTSCPHCALIRHLQKAAILWSHPPYLRNCSHVLSSTILLLPSWSLIHHSRGAALLRSHTSSSETCVLCFQSEFCIGKALGPHTIPTSAPRRHLRRQSPSKTWTT